MKPLSCRARPLYAFCTAISVEPVFTVRTQALGSLGSVPAFDLVIADEAHRAGPVSSDLADVDLPGHSVTESTRCCGTSPTRRVAGGPFRWGFALVQ